jgi:hypothetical protein
MPEVTAWADAFGVWYVRVPKDDPNPKCTASERLREEIWTRWEDTYEEVWKNPVRVPELDTEDTLVYREFFVAGSSPI